MGEGGTWLCVPRTKIKTEMGRDGKGGFAISLSEVLGLVQPWELLPHHHQPRRWGWAPPLLWLSHSLWRGCQPCEMVHRHSFCTWECCYFTATQATEKVYFFVFFLMARNTPTEFGFKRGGEYSDRNTEGGREGAASRGWKLPMVHLPAPDKQYGNEVNVCKKKKYFLPGHQNLKGDWD